MKVYPLALRGTRRATPPHWLQALLIVLCMLLNLATPPARPQGAGPSGRLAAILADAPPEPGGAD